MSTSIPERSLLRLGNRILRIVPVSAPRLPDKGSVAPTVELLRRAAFLADAEILRIDYPVMNAGLVLV